MSGVPDGAVPAAHESSDPASAGESSLADERIRLLKAAALGFALGLLLARWGEPVS